MVTWDKNLFVKKIVKNWLPLFLYFKFVGDLHVYNLSDFASYRLKLIQGIN